MLYFCSKTGASFDAHMPFLKASIKLIHPMLNMSVTDAVDVLKRLASYNNVIQDRLDFEDSRRSLRLAAYTLLTGYKISSDKAVFKPVIPFSTSKVIQPKHLQNISSEAESYLLAVNDASSKQFKIAEIDEGTGYALFSRLVMENERTQDLSSMAANAGITNLLNISEITPIDEFMRASESVLKICPLAMGIEIQISQLLYWAYVSGKFRPQIDSTEDSEESDESFASTMADTKAIEIAQSLPRLVNFTTLSAEIAKAAVVVPITFRQRSAINNSVRRLNTIFPQVKVKQIARPADVIKNVIIEDFSW